MNRNKPVTNFLAPDSKVLHYTTRIVVMLIAVGAAVLSFDALTSLAINSGIRPVLGWIWAIIIDGFILVATFAAFALRDRKSKYYAWFTLTLFVILSVLGNAWHAAISQNVNYQLPLWVSTLVTAIPPVALFLSIHLLILMISPTPEQKKFLERQRAREDRLAKIEQRELDKIETEITKTRVHEDGKKIVSKLKDTQKPFTEPEKEKPSEPPATTERSKNLISTLTQDENQNDVIKKIRTLIHNKEPLPSGKEVGEWLGKTERTGQKLLKQIKQEEGIIP